VSWICLRAIIIHHRLRRSVALL